MKLISNDIIMVELQLGQILSTSKFLSSLINNSTTCCFRRRTLHLLPLSTLRVMINLPLMAFPFLNDSHQRPHHHRLQGSTTQ